MRWGHMTKKIHCRETKFELVWRNMNINQNFQCHVCLPPTKSSTMTYEQVIINQSWNSLLWKGKARDLEAHQVLRNSWEGYCRKTAGRKISRMEFQIYCIVYTDLLCQFEYVYYIHGPKNDLTGLSSCMCNCYAFLA